MKQGIACSKELHEASAISLALRAFDRALTRSRHRRISAAVLARGLRKHRTNTLRIVL